MAVRAHGAAHVLCPRFGRPVDLARGVQLWHALSPFPATSCPLSWALLYSARCALSRRGIVAESVTSCSHPPVRLRSWRFRSRRSLANFPLCSRPPTSVLAALPIRTQNPPSPPPEPPRIPCHDRRSLLPLTIWSGDRSPFLEAISFAMIPN
jgi:hypothetical protein